MLEESTCRPFSFRSLAALSSMPRRRMAFLPVTTITLLPAFWRVFPESEFPGAKYDFGVEYDFEIFHDLGPYSRYLIFRFGRCLDTLRAAPPPPNEESRSGLVGPLMLCQNLVQVCSIPTAARANI